MASRISIIAFIFMMACGAWWILGGSMKVRTDDLDTVLKARVAGLWGSEQQQEAPSVEYIQYDPVKSQVVRGKDTVTETTMEKHVLATAVDQSKIAVTLDLNHRKKGLLWYSTYRVGFDGSYRITNTTAQPHEYTVAFSFPSATAVYDSFRVLVNDQEVAAVEPSGGVIRQVVNLEPAKSAVVRITYASQGMDRWWYSFGNSISQVRDFSLHMTTNFDDVNFPDNSMSPTTIESTPDGRKLAWDYGNLLSGTRIGMEMPAKLNPGPFVARVSFFAPVSLFLFFFLIFMITIVRNIRLHPMNYFFLAAAFFSFHLLLAYLVDHIDVYWAMAIASVTSVALVVSYMRLVVGRRFALVEVGLSQLFYLVLFSYAFFLEGYTGLTITVSCIITLFILMQVTAKINWEEKFGRETRPAYTPPPPPVAR